MQACLFCSRKVLDLVGQDEILDTNCLSGKESEIVDAGIYGACHSRCLEGSRWAKRWAEIRIHSLVSKRAFELLETSDATICADPRGSGTVICLPTYRCITVTDDHTEIDGSGKLLSIFHEVNWKLPDSMDQVQFGISFRVQTPLRKIASIWNVSDCYDEIVLSNGVFYETGDTEENIASGYLCGRVKYPLALPKAAHDFVRAQIRG